jgi:hypothetical protein
MTDFALIANWSIVFRESLERACIMHCRLYVMLMCLWPAVAFPQEQGVTIPPAMESGNLSMDFYVKSNCDRPNKLSLPKPIPTDRDGVMAYNEAVKRYNIQSKAFGACIDDYVEKASIDIDRILFTANMAVAKANGSNPPSPPIGPGNMPSSFYPSPQCIMPDKELGAPPDGRDSSAMETYNAKVRAFNALAEDFNKCIEGYVARAHVDVERIARAQRDAASRVNEQ